MKIIVIVQEMVRCILCMVASHAKGIISIISQSTPYSYVTKSGISYSETIQGNHKDFGDYKDSQVYVLRFVTYPTYVVYFSKPTNA